MAYRAASNPYYSGRAIPSRKRRDSGNTRAIVLTGGLLVSLSAGAITLLATSNRETEFAADHAVSQNRLIVAMQERLPPPKAIDRSLPIDTPGPHVKVAAVPLPAPRPVPAPEPASTPAPPPMRPQDPETLAYAVESRREPIKPEKLPAQFAAVGAMPLPRELDMKPTGSVGAVTAPVPPSPPKPKRALTAYEKLYGGTPVQVAALTPSNVVMRDASPTLPVAPYDKQTAVYVISSRKVYLPDGTELEAHSGLGDYMDNPKFAHVRMRGVTPPHVYSLRMREALFHGVEAIRLTPLGGERAIFGRDGLLAHTYMLGPRGDSNGCVSFKNYNAFLRAFKDKKFDRLAVIAQLD
jgi:hypothetical protein